MPGKETRGISIGLDQPILGQLGRQNEPCDSINQPGHEDDGEQDAIRKRKQIAQCKLVQRNQRRCIEQHKTQ